MSGKPIDYLEEEIQELEESIREMVLTEDFFDIDFKYECCKIKLSLLHQELLKVLLGGTTV